MVHISRADVVTSEIDFRSFTFVLRKLVIKRMRQSFNRCAGTKVGTADPNYDEHVGIVLDFSCSFLNACEFFFIILSRKIDPAPEICACSRTVM
ncbi:hypothetical protein D3C80_1946890 [compost metagenome]